MKKLLLLFAAALSAASSFAYDRGDFVYTPNGRFQIVGDNLLKNGDFSNGTTGWTNLYGQPLSSDTLAVEDDGPNGMKCLTVKGGNMGMTNWGYQCANFVQEAELTENTTYILTYKVRAYVPNMSSVGIYGRYWNHQDFVILANSGSYPLAGSSTDESGKVTEGAIFGYSTCSDQWEERAMNYYADANKVMAALFFELVNGDSFADFGIYEAKQVCDDRIAQDAIDYLNFLIDDTANFPEGDRDGLKEAAADLKGYLGGDAGVSDLSETLKGIFAEEGPVTPFLDDNSADVSSYYGDFTFDNSTAISPGKTYTPTSGWTSASNRWGIGAPAHNLTTNHLMMATHAGVDLPESTISASANLPAGKYLYVVRGMGYKYGQDGSGSSNNYYIPDFYGQIEGVKYFINDEYVEMTDFSPSYAKQYIHIFDVKEDGTQTIGFYNPLIYKSDTGSTPPTGHTGGGNLYFDNVEIRILGVTPEDVLGHFYKETLAEKQADLTAAIATAKETTESAKYVFDKQVLKDSITVSESVLAATTTPSQESIDILTTQKNYMNAAVSAYIKINAEYTQLGNDIELCKTELADENRPKGKDAFSAAITTAETYYNAQTETSRDSLKLVETDETLLAARYTYGMTNASVDAPAEIPLVNGTFSTKNSTGWIIDPLDDDGKNAWKYESNADFTDGYCIYFNRGYSATNQKWVYQDVDITENGVYRFQAEVICNNSSWGAGDTSGNSDMYLFMNNDSVMVITPGLGDKSQEYPGNVRPCYIDLKVADAAALTIGETSAPYTLRVGLTCKKDGPTVYPNLIYFGSCHLYYLGSIADYETGITDVNVVAPVINGDVYSINGVKVRANATTLQGLPKGIYIMNGKKFVVR